MKKYFSKEHVTCQFENCGMQIRRDRLKDHEKTAHADQLPKNQGSLFKFLMRTKKKSDNEEACGSSEISETPNLSNVSKLDNICSKTTPVPVKKIASAPTTTKESKALKSSSYYCGKLQDSIDFLKKKFTKNKSSDDQTNDDTFMDVDLSTLSKDDLDTQEQESTAVTSQPNKKRKLNSPTVTNIVSIEADNQYGKRFDQLEKYLVDLTKKVDNLKLNEGEPSDSTSQAESEYDFEKELTQIRSAKSVKDIMDSCSYFEKDELNNTIKCKVCFKKDSTAGVFGYDFEGETNYKGKKMEKKFSNLKISVGRHVENKNHQAYFVAERKKKQFEVARAKQIGKRLGRAAYKEMKKGGSYLNYEDQVAVLAADGTDVGNINHSRKFVSEFEKDIYEVLRETTIETLNAPLHATGRPTPFAVIGDKVTPKRRTHEVVGIYGFIDGKFQSIVAGVPPVEAEHGIGVTQTLKTGLKSLNIEDLEIQSRCVGGAFDGEYFNLDVPNHLLKESKANEDAKDWYSFQWDPAHVIQLAEADTRKSTHCKDIQSKLDVISNVSKIVSYGKAYRQLVAISEEPEEEVEVESTTERPLRQPRIFSATRFATYSSEVIKTFNNNYENYYKYLDRKQMDELDSINNASFLYTTGALQSSYEVIGKMSNAVQKPDIPPWEVTDTINTYLDTLDNMAENLKQPDLSLETLNKNHFPYLENMVKEVTEKGEYRQCPILVKKSNTQRTRRSEAATDTTVEQYSEALRKVGKEVAKFNNTFTKKARERFEKEEKRNPVLETCGKLFDITKVSEYNNYENVEHELEVYVELAKKTKNLEENITIDDIKAKYDIYIERVKSLVEEFKYKNKTTEKDQNKVIIDYPLRVNQLELYKKMYRTKELYQNIEPVLHMSLTANCRTHCESVVEGMGSILTVKNEQRGSLSEKSLERETFIRWQGPEPASDNATKLIERSLDRHFNGPNWHFTTTSSKFGTSEVLERKKKEAKQKDKILF